MQIPDSCIPSPSRCADACTWEALVGCATCWFSRRSKEYEVELSVPSVAAPGYQSWELIAQAGLPPGDYFLRGVYRNAPDSAYPFYDVYESGAEHAWEGLIETTPVPVLSCAAIGWSPAGTHRHHQRQRQCGCSGQDRRSRPCVAGRRCTCRRLNVNRRGWSRQPGNVVCGCLPRLAPSVDSEANSRLLAWIDTLSPQERSRAFSGLWLADALQPLMRTASACSGRTLASSYGAELVREFVARCPQFAAEARATIEAPHDPDRQGGAWDAKAGSVALLGKLGIPRTFRCCFLWRAVKSPR